ncbi:MAG: DUF72 domain-containing protein [Deltaproteobacteria bacterium]|nr:DUF72 domain-containing protein [Deltaproteobacteria bacterium]
MITSQVHFVGTSGFYYDVWQDVFYPTGLVKKNRLAHYVKHFNTVELNNPFYRLPKESTFAGWRDKAPAGFVFSLKASRFITHIKKLANVSEAVVTFLGRARHLQDHLGPVLFQLPPTLKRDDLLLKDFLSSLPVDCPKVIEFRHPSWYVDTIYQMLAEHKMGFCIHDAVDAPTPLQLSLADMIYLRFHGPDKGYRGTYGQAGLTHPAAWARETLSNHPHIRLYAYFNNTAGAALNDAVIFRDFIHTP